MASPAPPPERGPFGYQGFFLVLTLIVMVVIVFLSKSLTNSILVIGLVANFLIISSQLTLMGDRHVEDMRGRQAGTDPSSVRLGKSVMVNPGPWAVTAAAAPVGRFTATPPEPEPLGRKEGFLPAATTAPPGGSAPWFVNVPASDPLPRVRGGTPAPPYPGAIEFDYLETAPALGYSDRQAAAAETTPYGNPFADGRVSDPQAAPPCVDDDALQYFDCDEQNTYQARARNDPERVWAGIYRRKALVSRYVAEELEEAEQSRWWGLPEY